MRNLLVRLAAIMTLAAFSSFQDAPGQTASPPIIDKVEPPNWWPGHSWNPVRVLVRGSQLQGVRVESISPGIVPGLTRTNSRGSYAFIDLHIDPQAQTGRHSIRLAGPGGRSTFEFELLGELPRDGRFQGFSSDDVMYLLMPDRFVNGNPSNDDPRESSGLHDRGKARYYHGGDLQGVIDRLPYLQDLGVTALWMNPWYDNNNSLNEKETYDGEAITDYHGYGATDFYAVDEHLGDLAKLRELVDAAHDLGIKIIQDQVANHSGPYHPWVHDSPTPTWYNGTATDHLDNTWQTWTLDDPYATNEVQSETLEGWFIDILPDLNQDDEEAARYIVQNTLWWIGVSGIDAIRQDTLPYVHRRFWRDWMAAIKREYPDFKVVGELFDGDPNLVSFFQGGRARFDGIDSGIDALFDFPLFFPVREVFAKGQSIRQIANMLSKDRLYVDPNKLVTFVGLHDVERFMNVEGADLTALKLAHTLIFTARGIPLIYYGDEIAMPGGNDPDNRRDFPGGWHDDPRNAFEESGRTADQQQVFSHIRELAHLRRELRALRRGTMLNLLVGEQTWAFARVEEGAPVLVLFNNSRKPEMLQVPTTAAGFDEGSRLQDRLGTGQETVIEGGRVQVKLAPRTAAIYVVSQ